MYVNYYMYDGNLSILFFIESSEMLWFIKVPKSYASAE